MEFKYTLDRVGKVPLQLHDCHLAVSRPEELYGRRNHQGSVMMQRPLSFGFKFDNTNHRRTRDIEGIGISAGKNLASEYDRQI